MTSLTVAYAPQIAAAAARHHLDARLLAAVAAQETGGPGADSGRNVVGDGGHGRGLFQIDDRYHPFAREPAAMDPGRNADYAAGILQSNLRRYGGDLRAALSAYNAGSPGATGTRTDWGDGKRLGYADSVLRHYARLGGGSGSTAATQAATGTAAAPDLGELMGALRALAGQLGGGAACAIPLQLPQRQPLPAIDQHILADTAPSAAAGDDDPAGATASGAAASA